MQWTYHEPPTPLSSLRHATQVGFAGQATFTRFGGLGGCQGFALAFLAVVNNLLRRFSLLSVFATFACFSGFGGSSNPSKLRKGEVAHHPRRFWRLSVFATFECFTGFGGFGSLGGCRFYRCSFCFSFLLPDTSIPKLFLKYNQWIPPWFS